MLHAYDSPGSGHVIRGIDFSDGPRLQRHLFSYVDTQLNRHGGPNFVQLPIVSLLPFALATSWV